MISFKSNNSHFDDDNEFDIKESSSLLSNNKESAPKYISSASSSTNVY